MLRHTCGAVGAVMYVEHTYMLVLYVVTSSVLGVVFRILSSGSAHLLTGTYPLSVYFLLWCPGSRSSAYPIRSAMSSRSMLLHARFPRSYSILSSLVLSWKPTWWCWSRYRSVCRTCFTCCDQLSPRCSGVSSLLSCSRN